MKQICKQPTIIGKPGIPGRPVRIFRQGNCSASIFFNAVQVNGEIVEQPSVSFAKLYRRHGQWKRSSSLGLDDLTTAIVVLGQAYEWLEHQEEVEGVRPDEP